MAQNKEDQFIRHTNLLKKKMEEGVWGDMTFVLQNGFIVQSRLKQTFVTDTNSKEDLISQAEAETRAFEKKQKKNGYRFINVVDKNDQGCDR